ncbi:MAG: DNA repair protein RadA [Acidobacteria bacterium]|nr:DNA repair protein RadA [Acidobacteriota bacterium]
MRTAKNIFSCQACGYQSSKWLGRCPDCEAWNSFIEEVPQDRPAIVLRSDAKVEHYPEIENWDGQRITTANPEFDRVLGGGLVPGSVVLLGGEPGIGKSTLLLQICETLAQQGMRVLYVSGEESAHQIKLRGMRLQIRGDRLYLFAETCLEKILAEMDRIQPHCVVVDSVQTVYSSRMESSAGTVTQVREVASQLLYFAKGREVPVFLIGHITKEGSLAGPKTLEHIVDVVLYFEGSRDQSYRLVRAAKNRFGASSELGVFEMSGLGLRPVSNPSKLFLTERSAGMPGSVVLGSMEGTRPLLVEVQALVSVSQYGTGKRTTNGLDSNRLSLLLAMLQRRCGYELHACDVYVNAVGGLSLVEPAVDLAITVAVVSSLLNRPTDPDLVVFGELGLAGEVRSVCAAGLRAREARSLGFSRCALPAGNLPLSEEVEGLELIGMQSLQPDLQRLLL